MYEVLKLDSGVTDEIQSLTSEHFQVLGQFGDLWEAQFGYSDVHGGMWQDENR